MNDLLRRALADAGITERDVAARVGVDLKSVQRWAAGRTPYARNRRAVADLLGVDEAALWPQVAERAVAAGPPVPEVMATYAHRWDVPRSAWRLLFERARRQIDVLAFAGLFLAEDAGLLRTLAGKAREGVGVRILLGSPEGARVAERGDDEGVGESLAAKIRNALVGYRPLGEVPGVEIRLHDTVLYASIYRADDDLLINHHVYGVAAASAPVIHVRRVEGGDMASTYLDSFERVWSAAAPVE
ncbi:helix-turn-helix domain-containing protein [Actinomadura parmotrematis]|uniref:Helix-turn-helix domain-containing protein n=1 Tax=Actinomadura parmotrematis TaxID=2864039 RepID=A0ABS7FPF6_9ACTN|nr:helix-turn-helix transcriptional regulator [Actinomadura parmotrematis]MBW8482254.1 helix-turn-helix domain-containing protein [Actinomadura parmotrematis]